MRHQIQLAIQQLFAERALFLLALGLFIAGSAYVVYTALNLSPTDLQLAIRFTSFGDTHFYREKWWYLLSFVGFGMVFIVIHLAVMAKLNLIGLKQLAFAFGWLSAVILVIAFVYTYHVLNIAYLN